MHELSIAGAILDSARRLTPAGARLTAVTLRAGPMRGIEPAAMQWAWQAATADTDYSAVKLALEVLPWRLQCPDCAAEFEASDVLAPCACGGQTARPIGGDELQIVAIEVDDAAGDSPKPEQSHRKEARDEGRGRRKRTEAQ